MLHPSVIHHEHDHIGFCATDQQAKLTPCHLDAARRAPADAIWLTAGEKARSVFSSDNESAFLEVRDYYNAARLIEQVCRDVIVGCICHRVQITGRSLEPAIYTFICKY